VRLTPRARTDRVDGLVALADGAALKIAVAAPPLDGRANEALLQLLAKEWRLTRRDLSIAAGEKSRNKLVHVAGDPEALLARLGPWLAAQARC